MWILYYLITCGVIVLVFPKKTFLWRYAWNSLIALDNTINAWVFLGDPDETISSHAYKGYLKGHRGWTLVHNILEKIDPGHGERAVEWDEGTSSGLSPLFTRKK
jgi:hypothetical protein